jgi:hypothetical protein
MNPVSLSLDGTCTTPRPFSSPGRGLLCPQRRTTSTNAEGGSSQGLGYPLITSLGNNRAE